MDVYEVYDYPKKGKIFSEYVNTFYKMKQESSGIPTKCLNPDGSVSDELFQRFLDAYEKHEGVKLDASQIKDNPGRRAVMKLILNALWGKFAQNENVTVVSFIDDFFELLSLINDNSVEVTSLDFINENLARTTHRKTHAALTVLKDRNVVIAAFVTSYARIELFELMMKQPERVLYNDTDSVFLLVLPGNVPVETGDFLGDLTDELNCKSPPNVSKKWIVSFCSTGPKSYSYKTNMYDVRDKKTDEVTKKQDVIVHAKGFSVKGDAAKQITFDSLSSCVRDKHRVITVKYRDVISRSTHQRVFVENVEKKFQFTFDKRIVLDNFFTIPYGYDLSSSFS